MRRGVAAKIDGRMIHRIMELRGQGLKQEAIAVDVGVAQGTVSLVLRRHGFGGLRRELGVTGLPKIDPTEPDERATDNDAKRVLFEEAKDFLADKGVFMLAVRALRIRWYGEWLDAETRDKQRDFRARLQCLDAIPLEIKRFVSDYSMAMDKARNVRNR